MLSKILERIENLSKNISLDLERVKDKLKEIESKIDDILYLKLKNYIEPKHLKSFEEIEDIFQKIHLEIQNFYYGLIDKISNIEVAKKLKNKIESKSDFKVMINVYPEKNFLTIAKVINKDKEEVATVYIKNRKVSYYVIDVYADKFRKALKGE